MAQTKPEIRKSNYVNKGVYVEKEDVHTLAVYALTTYNLKFKAFAEKLLREKAEEIRANEAAKA